VISSVASRYRRFALLAIPVVVFGCADSPTEVRPCELTPLDPQLVITISDASVLQPVLQDALTRIVPTLTAPPAELQPSFAALTAQLGTTDANTACRAFNAVAEHLAAAIAAAPAADRPDLDALRLSLRLVHAWLATA
jgi:hypothetical protein